MSMTSQDSIPSFSGHPADYRNYRLQVRWLVAATKTDKLELVGPALIRRLSGSAFEQFRSEDPVTYRTQDGAQKVLAVLDKHYAYLPETEVQDSIEQFLSCTRGRNQGPTEYSASFRAAVQRLERILSDQINQEQTTKHGLAMVEHERELRLHSHAMERWEFEFQTAAAQHGEEAAALVLGDPPQEPRPPPSKPPEITFHFPESFTGYLFLKGYGLTRQQRADTIRSAGGTTQFPQLERSLRAAEQSFEGEYSRRGVVFYGEEQSDWYYHEEDSAWQAWEEEEEEWQEDEDENYHEEEPEESYEDLDEVEAEAYVTYMQARQRLREVKQQRGFTDTPGKGKGKGKGKGSRSKGK
eukprot:6485278-Amphidinium_carterae.1